MGETLVIPKNSTFAAITEVTEGTAVAETDVSAFLVRQEGASINLSRELIEKYFMTGSLTKTAPQVGMYGEIGLTMPTMARGKGTLTAPDYAVFMKSLFGTQAANTDGVVDAGSTCENIVIKSGAGDIDVGQLVYFPDSSFVTRCITSTAGVSFTVSPPLPAVPSEDDDIIAGINWMLASSAHPSFTTYAYYSGDKRCRMAGNKTTSWTANFVVGDTVDMEFTTQALSITPDYTAQAVTPVTDTATLPLVCLGVDLEVYLEGTTTGTPTTTETILLAPTYDVTTDDSILIEVSAGVWETKAISNVSGNAGGNITLTHAAVSIAAGSGDTVKIKRVECANVGDTLSINMTAALTAEMCMAASWGKKSQSQTDRLVEISDTPYFKSWGPVLMRDAGTGSAVKIMLGDTLDNMFAVYIAKRVYTDVSVETGDELGKYSTTSWAVADAELGNDYEIQVAAF